MSSRLFQEIREKRGLAYSMYSFASGHADTGVFGLYAGCTPAKVDEVVALLVAELERLADDGDHARPSSSARIGQLSGGLVLGLEDTGSRMSRLGKAELVHGELLSIDESLDRIRAVTAAGRAGPGRRAGRRARAPSSASARSATDRTPSRCAEVQRSSGRRGDADSRMRSVSNPVAMCHARPPIAYASHRERCER